MSLSRWYTDDGLPKAPVEPELGSSAARAERLSCDSCGEAIEGNPAGSGLFLWTRGDEIRYEEAPLCESCAPAIAYGASLDLDIFEDE